MRVPDRQKQRREYLRKKIEGIGKTTGGGLMLISVAFITTCFLVGTCTSILFALWTHTYSFLLLGAICAVVTAFCGGVCYDICQFINKTRQQQATMTYVPPVTANTLPAEEVLVRGAQEPTREQSSVLLRASEESDKVSPEELLRAAQGEE